MIISAILNNLNTSGLTTISNCNIIHFPKIQNRSGNITPIHNFKEIPFEVKRIFYLYDIPGGESRGAHAHKTCHQILIAASGSFEVRINDGISEQIIFLNRPYYGLHIPPMIWANELNFSSGSVCLVLTSQIYNPDDYIRNYEEFKNISGK